MDIPLETEVAGQLERFGRTLSGLETQLHSAVSVSREELNKAAPLQQAQLHMAVAHGLVALLSMYFIASGLTLDDPGVRQERERLKHYSRKVRRAVKEKELSEARRSLTVDVAAANRFIDHAIPDLTAVQRDALQQAGRKQRQHDAAQIPQPQQGAAKRRKLPRDEAIAFLDEALDSLKGHS